MHASRARWIAPVLALTVAAGGCDDGGPAGPDDSQTSLSVLLTDAPGAVEAVWVEVLNITLQGGEDGPVTLLDESTGLIQITDLVGTSQTLVSDQTLNAATYGQLRMVLGAAVLLAEDGGVYVMGEPDMPEYGDPAVPLVRSGELQCPSCTQSGLKVTIPGDEVVLTEGTAEMVLDFDVAQSFGHKAGASGKWVMNPTIHGTLVGGDGSSADPTGSIEGTVVLATDVTIPECPAGTPRKITDFVPSATGTPPEGGGDAIPHTGTVVESTEGGVFSIDPLAADTYSMGFQERFEFTGGTLVFGAGVDPTEAEITDGPVAVAYEITSATCEIP